MGAQNQTTGQPQPISTPPQVASPQAQSEQVNSPKSVSVLPLGENATVISPPKNIRKFPIKIFFISVVALALLGGGVYASISLLNNSGEREEELAPTTEEHVSTQYPNFPGIPVGQNTISFVKADGKFCILYNNKIYLPQDTGSFVPKVMSAAGMENFPWIGLVDVPEDITREVQTANEIFSFKASPRNESFIFVTRWTTAEGTEEYNVYRFNNDISKLMMFTYDFGLYFVPKVDTFSPGGNFVKFAMFQSPFIRDPLPETQLMYIPTKELRYLGLVTDFEWKEDGVYEYKPFNENLDASETPLRRNEFFEDSVDILPSPAPLSL